MTKTGTVYLRAGQVDAGSGRPILATLATAARQADGLALRMSGVRLDRFRSNPVLMVTHDYRRLPVGRVEDIQVGADRMTGRLTFAGDDEAQMIEGRVRAGVINAVSIGFGVDQDTVDRNGNVGAWELTEVSLVAVPMDAKALVYSRGVSRSVAVSAPQRRSLLAAFDVPLQAEREAAQAAAVRRAVLGYLADVVVSAVGDRSGR